MSAEARAEVRALRVGRRPLALLGALAGSLVVLAIAWFVFGNGMAKHDRQRERAMRFQVDIQGNMERLHAVRSRMVDASQHGDSAKLRAAQAERTQIQDEITRRQQEYLQGR